MLVLGKTLFEFLRLVAQGFGIYELAIMLTIKVVIDYINRGCCVVIVVGLGRLYFDGLVYNIKEVLSKFRLGYFVILKLN